MSSDGTIHIAPRELSLVTGKQVLRFDTEFINARVKGVVVLDIDVDFAKRFNCDVCQVVNMDKETYEFHKTTKLHLSKCEVAESVSSEVVSQENNTSDDQVAAKLEIANLIETVFTSSFFLNTRAQGGYGKNQTLFLNESLKMWNEYFGPRHFLTTDNKVLLSNLTYKVLRSKLRGNIKIEIINKALKMAINAAERSFVPPPAVAHEKELEQVFADKMATREKELEQVFTDKMASREKELEQIIDVTEAEELEAEELEAAESSFVPPPAVAHEIIDVTEAKETKAEEPEAEELEAEEELDCRFITPVKNVAAVISIPAAPQKPPRNNVDDTVYNGTSFEQRFSLSQELGDEPVYEYEEVIIETDAEATELDESIPAEVVDVVNKLINAVVDDLDHEVRHSEALMFNDVVEAISRDNNLVVVDEEEAHPGPTFVTKEYNDGTYVGFVDANGFRCKNGKMTYFDGSTHDGEWLHDKKNGHGVTIYNDGARYKGSWVDDLRHGYGVMTYIDGTFAGFFDSDYKTGEGTMTYSDGATYKGQWFGMYPNGKGVFKSPDGSIYDGDFINGLKHGTGVETYPDGGYYDGHWRKDLRSGYGEEKTFTGKYSHLYKGNWRKNLKHGHGDLQVTPLQKTKDIYAVSYSGSYFHDVYNGYGKMVWTDGCVQEGEWKYGVFGLSKKRKSCSESVEVPKKRFKHKKIKSIMGDGNCLPRAVSYRIYGTEDHHQLVRHACFAYLKRNDLLDYLEDDEKENFMESGVQIGQAAIKAMAELYGCKIVVVSRDGTIHSIYNDHCSTTLELVWSGQEPGHYDVYDDDSRFTTDLFTENHRQSPGSFERSLA